MSPFGNTAVFRVDPKNPDKGTIASCAAAIRKGSLVAFPTETVYGIAANMLDARAVARLYDVKKRPPGKPFTVHIADRAMIEKMGCLITKEASRLMDRFWPGPLTIILKAHDGKSIGFRMPANRLALELISASGVPVFAPSANLSGKAAPSSKEEILADLDGKIDMLLDGGRTTIGVESTVVDMTVNPPDILREGAIKKKELLEALHG